MPVSLHRYQPVSSGDASETTSLVLDRLSRAPGHRLMVTAAPRDVFSELKHPRKVSKVAKVLKGAVGVIALPGVVEGGAVFGALSGARKGAKLGHRAVPVAGGIVGAVGGAAAGAVINIPIEIKNTYAQLRREIGRYRFVDGCKIMVKNDSCHDLSKILNAIPADRLSQDDATGHTLINLRCEDIDHLSNQDRQFDSNGTRQIDFTDLLEKSKKVGLIAIKAKDFDLNAQSNLALSRIKQTNQRERRLSVYIPKGIEDQAVAARAGLQFIAALESAVEQLPHTKWSFGFID